MTDNLQDLNQHDATPEDVGTDHRSEPETAKNHALEREVDAETQHGTNKASREAAKYRTQLKETRTELEALAAQRDNLLRHSIEAQLPEQLSPQLFWKINEDPTAFLSEDGTLDGDQLKAATEAIVEEYRLNQAAKYPVIGGVGKTPSKRGTNVSIADAFRPKSYWED